MYPEVSLPVLFLLRDMLLRRHHSPGSPEDPPGCGNDTERFRQRLLRVLLRSLRVRSSLLLLSAGKDGYMREDIRKNTGYTGYILLHPIRERRWQHHVFRKRKYPEVQYRLLCQRIRIRAGSRLSVRSWEPAVFQRIQAERV